MTKPIKLLFLSAENPFPSDSGGKIRTSNILHTLSPYTEIDLITYENGGKYPEGKPAYNTITVPKK